MRIKQLFSFCDVFPAFLAIISALMLLEMEGTAHAQGIERESLAGENAAQALHNTNLENQPYNFQIGPINLRLEAGATVSFNDNINLARTERQTDGILAPSLGLHALWQATEENALTLDLGLSYQHYIEHSTYDAFLVSPDSQVQFNVFVGDFKINFHDDFSYQNDPVQVGQLSNVAQFDRFSNDVGIKTDWDLGDIIVSLAYNHNNFWVFEPAFKYLDYQSDTLTPQITFNVSKTIQTGLTASFSETRYDQNIQNDSSEATGGAFVSAQVSSNLSVNAQAGLIYSNFDHGGRNGDTQNINSYYLSAGVSHRINDVLTESLTAGREFLPGITSNFTQRTYANYSPAWQVTSNINLVSQLWWENLDDSNATFRETSNRFGAGLTLGWAVTDHATVSLGYQYVVKISDVSLLNYYQDVATLGFRYEF